MPLDLNSDLGEGFGPWAMGDDAAMLDLVTVRVTAGTGARRGLMAVCPKCGDELKEGAKATEAEAAE